MTDESAYRKMTLDEWVALVNERDALWKLLRSLGIEAQDGSNPDALSVADAILAAGWRKVK